MCLIFFAYKSHPDFNLVLAANRDEFLNRPSAKLSKWDGIYGGQDLKSGGTWLGITENGKFCAITNIRSLEQIENAPSRGDIVKNYLTCDDLPNDYLSDLMNDSDIYNGFNLVLGDRASCFHFNNKERKINKLQPGVYGLSNATLNTPWPKLSKGKKRFEELMKKSSFNKDEYFNLLRDDSKPPAAELPETGVGLEWEKILSSIHIESESYGTRCASLIAMGDREVNFYERTFDKGGEGDTNVTFKLL
jgi:uncharacterized protein with NRDE domain